MDTKQPEALRLAYTLDLLAMDMKTPRMAATELRRQHAENESLRAGYDAARLEIESLKERVQQLGQLARDVNSRRVTELEAQLAAVGAGGVGALRKRECLHKISEPVQPVAQDAERYRWLRDHRGWQVLHRIRPGKSIEYRMRDDGDWWGSWWPTHEQAIDAARAAQKGTND